MDRGKRLPYEEERSKPGEVVINIVKAIQTLYSLGARDFLIPNLPDLGLTPMVQMTEGGRSPIPGAYPEP